jgi:hypothetical protein
MMFFFIWVRRSTMLAGLMCALFLGCLISAMDTAAAATDVGTGSGSSGIQAAPQYMRLMTAEQYVNTLRYIFGPQLRIDARFAPLVRHQGLLENGATYAGVTDAQMEQYQRTAALVAAQVVDPDHRDYLIPCKPKDERDADGACATKFFSNIGRLLYRRPLSKEKLARVVDAANAGADRLQGFYPGVALALESMLMSPEVLFVTDTYESDPHHKAELRLDAYSLAQRLSFFLWNAAPDDTLLRAAETAEIHTTRGRERIVDMMLASPRLEAGMRAFFDDMLGFEDFDSLAKDPKIYPKFNGVTAADAREQTLRTIINYLFAEKKDYRELFTTRETFISPALAAVYGVAAGKGWTAYEIPENSGRAGILTQVSFLALHAHPGRSSPTRRGKALRELFLCQNVPNPPANVDFSKVENPDPALRTMRERLSAHRANPVCAGCHRITDPIGLALENFDGGGEFRATENGAPIDASGTLDGKSFNDPIGLAKVLHDEPALPNCLVQRIYAYGSGGPTTPADKPLLNYLSQQFAAEGYRVPDLLRTITLSPAFDEGRPEALGGNPGSQPKVASAP